MPKFLVDEDMPLSSAKLRRQRGFDAVHVKETGLSGKLDSDIFAFAQIEKRIVVTRDRGFANTLDYPIGAHWGIIVFRVPYYFRALQINKVLANFMDEVNLPEVEKSLTIVEPKRFRIRKPQPNSD